MLGSVPRWPCGYIQRPYLLLRFLVLLSLSLSSSLFLLLSLLPPSSLLFLSRHAFDMRISKYTHASSAKRSPIWRTPFFFPPLPVSIFLLVVSFSVILLVSRFVGGHYGLCSPRKSRFDRFNLIFFYEIMTIFLWKFSFLSRKIILWRDLFRKYRRK